MTERYVCIHGHFYQPPRENPGLEAVEAQDSARPWHDWNERITAECYAPNGAARVLDDAGFVTRVVNNYARISFDVGPTLVSWLERCAPRVLARIVDADRDSRARFSGHGAALAQPYHHVILPLSTERDRRTELAWGVREFELRFGRRPEGAWLPETAVDVASLEALAERGIEFTVLAPKQAAATRAPGESDFVPVERRPLDPRRAYRVRLPSGRAIAAFFYEASISQAVAFERLLDSGRAFVDRLAGAFDDRDEPQLVSIATDGESYGHHHRFGEMALAFALDRIESRSEGLRLTTFGEFLARHPPRHEVKIAEPSAWSCAHGVGRWRTDCGCRFDSARSQAWRGPLRDALSWLRDRAADAFEHEAGEMLADPWGARDAYADVLLQRGDAALDALFSRHHRRRLNAAERVRARELLESQRHALAMFSSCGWFFDDLAGIEAQQVLAHADRVLQLLGTAGVELEDAFLHRLAEARSNDPAAGDGRRIFLTEVRPRRVDPARVAAHAAVRVLLAPAGEDPPTRERFHAWSVRRFDDVRVVEGRTALVVGRLAVESGLTGTAQAFVAAAAHFGGHVIAGGVAPLSAAKADAERDEARRVADLSRAFRPGDLASFEEELERSFPGGRFALPSLLADERRRALERVLEGSMREIEAAYRTIIREHASLLRQLFELGAPLPPALEPAVRFALRSELHDLLSRLPPEGARVTAILEQAHEQGVSLDPRSLQRVFGATIGELLSRLEATPERIALLEQLREAVGLLARLRGDDDLWRVQAACFDLAERVQARMEHRARSGDVAAAAWLAEFAALCAKARVRPPQP